MKYFSISLTYILTVGTCSTIHEKLLQYFNMPKDLTLDDKIRSVMTQHSAIIRATLYAEHCYCAGCLNIGLVSGVEGTKSQKVAE